MPRLYGFATRSWGLSVVWRVVASGSLWLLSQAVASLMLYQLHQATCRIRRLMVYNCPLCDASSHVWVVGVGVGSGPRGIFSILGIGQAQADDRAAEAAEKNLEFTLRLATCPVCHRNNRRALLRVQVPVAALALAIAAFGAYMLRMHMLRGDINWFNVFVFGLLCPAAGYYHWALQRRKWRAVNDQLEFVTEHEYARMEDADEEALRRALRRRQKSTKRRRRDA